MKSIMFIFIFVFCLTSVSAFADDCAGEVKCEYSLQGLNKADSYTVVDECVCCGIHQIKTLGTAMMFPVRIVKETIFSSPPEKSYYSFATVPLLEPPAA